MSLGTDDATDSDRGDPHDDADHPHDHLVDNKPEVDDWLGTLAHTAEDGTEGETEEDNAESVGAGPVAAIHTAQYQSSQFYKCNHLT